MHPHQQVARVGGQVVRVTRIDGARVELHVTERDGATSTLDLTGNFAVLVAAGFDAPDDPSPGGGVVIGELTADGEISVTINGEPFPLAAALVSCSRAIVRALRNELARLEAQHAAVT